MNLSFYSTSLQSYRLLFDMAELKIRMTLYTQGLTKDEVDKILEPLVSARSQMTHEIELINNQIELLGNAIDKLNEMKGETK